MHLPCCMFHVQCGLSPHLGSLFFYYSALKETSYTTHVLFFYSWAATVCSWRNAKCRVRAKRRKNCVIAKNTGFIRNWKKTEKNRLSVIPPDYFHQISGIAFWKPGMLFFKRDSVWYFLDLSICVKQWTCNPWLFGLNRLSSTSVFVPLIGVENTLKYATQAVCCKSELSYHSRP